MIKKINLLSLLLVISICSFGQFFNKNHRFMRPKTEPNYFNSENQNIYLLNSNINYYNSNVFEEKLDSVRLVGYNGFISEKNEYKYDSNGNCIEDVWFISTDILQKYRKYNWTYNESNNLTEYCEYDWNETSNSWEERICREFTYSNNLLVQSSSQNRKVEYSYNSMNKVVEKKYFNPANNAIESNEWVLIQVDSFFYNSNNLKIKFKSYMSDTEKIPMNKIEYQYNEAGMLSKWNSYYWVKELNNWNNQQERNFSYDQNKNLTIVSIFSWNSEIKDFRGVYKIELTYDNSKNLLSCKKFDFEEKDNSWLQTDLFLYEYSSVGNLLNFEWYERTSSNELELNENISWEYDETVQTETIALPDIFEKPLVSIDNDVTYLGFSLNYNTDVDNKLIRGSYKGLYNGELTEWGEWQFHYSPFNTTDIDNFKKLSASIFPNPASDVINIFFPSNYQYLNLEIFDNDGRKLFEKIVFNNNPISIEKFNEGIYLYRLSDKESNSVQSGKLIIK
jgi:hypothetical protein